MFGRGKNRKENAEEVKDRDSLDKIESGSIVNTEWQMPELLAKRKRDSIGQLIVDSPEQAVFVLRKWLNSDLDK